jgi:hypothetical protein
MELYEKDAYADVISFWISGYEEVLRLWSDY